MKEEAATVATPATSTNAVEDNAATMPAEGSSTKKMTKKERAEHYKQLAFVEPQNTWRRVLKDIWVESGDDKEERIELSTSVCYSIFEMVNNPYEATLELYVILPDYGMSKAKSLAGLLLACLSSWVRKQSATEGELFAKNVTVEMQRRALSAGTEKHTTHLPVIVPLFRLLSPEFILQDIPNRVNELIVKKQFKEAMELVQFFRLFSRFQFEDFILPCLLQDRFEAVMNYAKLYPPMQAKIVAFLDSLVGLDSSELAERLKTYKEEKMTSNTGLQRLAGKSLDKVLMGVLQTFEMPRNLAPRLHAHRIRGDLKFTICYRDDTTDKKISQKIFDSIKQKVGNDDELQVFVARESHFHGYSEEAVLWAYYYNIHESRLPTAIRNMIESRPHLMVEAKEIVERFERNSPTSSSIPAFLFDGYPIIWVDTIEGVEEAVEHLKEHTLIGIDSEFRPTGLTSKQEVALLQVATPVKCFLVDFCEIPKILDENQLTRCLRALFTGPQYKIGFDMQSDVKAIVATLPFGDKILDEMQNVICLKRLVNEVLDVKENLMSMDLCTSSIERKERRERLAEEAEGVELMEGPRSFKLSDLVEVLLYQKLDKSQQMSNWSVRPLRPEQIKYAAMDAYVLLELFREIQNRVQKVNMNWSEILEAVVNKLEDKKKEAFVKQQRAKAKISEEQYAEIVEAVNARVLSSKHAQKKNTAFLADSMLNGIGKHLRRLGVDVIFTESRNELVQLAKAHPGRIILSTGKSADQLKTMYPFRTYTLPSAADVSLLEQVKLVLVKFEIALSDSDVFTRCMMCNDDVFVLAPAPVLAAMHENATKAADQFDDEPFDVPTWIEQIRQVAAEDYGGYGVGEIRESAEGDSVIVECTNGTLDIVKNVVMTPGQPAPTSVDISSIPKPVVERPNLFFFVCRGCGKIFWNGSQKKKYTDHINGIIRASQGQTEENEKAELSESNDSLLST